VDYLISSERPFQQDCRPHLKKRGLFGNSINQNVIGNKALL
jgi:hypothetical protein